ncbi:MAG: UDP-glucose/GDP-mannose dehydrogenase family protein, partial [Chloroflexota bacterium]|nr:UDP-glucose/GDP-mannose dehydrogenase family protein [Chloroflexota bacterium]
MTIISMVGTGYVGLTTAACLAEMGHTICCIDIDREKIARLQLGDIPIHEPGLGTMIETNAGEGRLRFSDDYPDGLRDAQFVVLAVGTPSAADGKAADLRYLYAAAKMVGRALPSQAVIINKSTSPIGTGGIITRLLDAERPDLAPWSVVSNPEFLREGSAVHDCLHPARVVLGANDPVSAGKVASLYQSLDCPVVVTDLNTAEMVKYAANAFLATRISFINEVARICDALDADVRTVVRGMGLDPRIGPAFLEAGLGYGGSCFPKDVAALTHMATCAGIRPQLLPAVINVNDAQRAWVAERMGEYLGDVRGRTIAMWGLTFKPNTDDLRESPALDIAWRLVKEGAKIRAYDPMASEAARDLGLPITVCASAYEATLGADAILLATDWDEFLTIRWDRVAHLMRGTLVFDGRNCLDA